MANAPIRKPSFGKSKYKNERTIYNHVGYASKAEARRAEELDGMVKAGLIRFWLPQVKFTLGTHLNVYRVDFLVYGCAGDLWAEDVKGMETPKFKKDKRLWAEFAAIDLHIIKNGRFDSIINHKGDS